MWRYLLSALLAGCAHTPMDVRERGDHFELHSRADAKNVTACMVHAIENANGNVRAQSRQTRDGYEIRAYLARSGIVLVADVARSADGSATDGYFDREAFYSVRDDLLSAMRGC